MYRTCLTHPEENWLYHHLKSTVIRPNNTSVSKRPSMENKRKIMTRFLQFSLLEKDAIQITVGSLYNHEGDAGDSAIKQMILYFSYESRDSRSLSLSLSKLSRN